MATDGIKLKGAVREIGIIRDSDRHDSFNIAINIMIKTEGKVTYDEAERLSNKYRREYLGKDVEFVSVNIPCPYCDKILNSKVGLKQHILKLHPEKAGTLDQLKPSRIEKNEKKGKKPKIEKISKKNKRQSESKIIKNSKTKLAKKSAPIVKKVRPRVPEVVSKPAKLDKPSVETKRSKTNSTISESERRGKQLKLF